MEAIKRHLAPIMFLIALCVTVVIFARISTAKDNGTFEWIDVHGDRRALDHVTISGELRDGYHSTHFAIAEGVLSTRVEIYSGPVPPLEEAFHPGRKREFEAGHRFEARRAMSGGELDFDIVYEDRSRLPKEIVYKRALVRTGLDYHQDGYRPDQEHEFSDYTYGQGPSYTFTNDLNYGIAKAAGCIYFTVPTTTDYTGTNGIFEITEFVRRVSSEDDLPIAREFTTFSLEKNKPFAEKGSEHPHPGTTGIEVLGLEGVGDKLALLLAEDGKLIIRGFDTASGEEIGEAVIEDFVLYGADDRGTGPNRIAHHPSYTAHSDHEAHVLNMYFDRAAESPDMRELLLISIDFTEGVRLADRMVRQYPSDELDQFHGVFLQAYRNGKTYIARTIKASAETSPIVLDIARPIRFVVDVYERGEHIYRGELKTDRNDDFIRAARAPISSAGFSYNPAEYRNFDRIRIR